MEQTLSKVKNLEKFIKKHGEDFLISQTISKMAAYKIQRYERKIERLDQELKKFEQIYNKKSPVFVKEFKEGKLGDEMDFVEWSSLFQMIDRLTEKKKELENMI